MADAHSSCFSLNVIFVGLIGFLLAATHLPLQVLCTASFSMEMMHRDHPESPLHNTTSTAFGDPFVLVTDFVVRVKLGEHDREVALAISFTGLLWVKCTPCIHCYSSTQPEFDQGESGSYFIISCQTEFCRLIHGECDWFNYCKFKENFPNGGHATGLLSFDKMILRSNNGERYLHNTIFGCIHGTEGYFNNGILGIFGLGPTNHSFVVQMRRYSIDNIFSYCLPKEIGRSSSLVFGSSAYVPAPSPYLSTPMDMSNNMYRVTVTNIRIIGDKPINIIYNDIFVMNFAHKFTYVDQSLLDSIISGVKSVTPFPTIIVPDTKHKLCLDVSRGWREDQMPTFVLILDSGAEYVLELVNAFEIVKKNALCLTMLSNKRTGGKSIIGRNAQYKKRLVFDLGKRTFAFQPKISC